MDIDDDFFSFGFFGQTYNFTNQQEQAIAANVTSVQVVSDRGDISVSAWDEPKVKVIALPAKWKTESAPARVIALVD